MLYEVITTPVAPVDTSAFLVHVDGVYVGRYPLVAADGEYADVRAFLPAMPVGNHTVRLFWDNVHTRLSARIREVKLQGLGGPDNNGNGVKDWVEASVAAMAGVDHPTQSYISPACIEGKARYVSMMSLVSQSPISIV